MWVYIRVHMCVTVYVRVYVCLCAPTRECVGMCTCMWVSVCSHLLLLGPGMCEQRQELRPAPLRLGECVRAGHRKPPFVERMKEQELGLGWRESRGR